MRRAVSRWHRWLGLALVAPLLVWASTGLLFHIKPGWAGAYEMLSATRDTALGPALVTPQHLAIAAGGSVTRIDYLSTVVGPVARVTRADGTSLHDASSGTLLSPLDEAVAQRLVADAIARSSHPDRYAGLRKLDATDDELRFGSDGGATVTLDRHRLTLSQRGTDTDRIDWLYRMHYLQWTGSRAVDRVVGIAGIAAIWILAGLGVALAIRRRALSRRTGLA